MITKFEDLYVDRPVDLHGGNGSPTIRYFMDDSTSQGAGRLFAKIELDPGVHIGYHQHNGEQEAFFFLKGVATVEDNEKKKHEMQPGDSYICFDGEYHSLANETNEPISLIAVITYTGLRKS